MRLALLALVLVAIPAASQASSPDVWADFRAAVRAKCLAAAPDMKAPAVVVHPIGSEHYGVAVLISGGDKRICIYDKQAKTAELTPAT
jgi:hypothetical protein